MLKVNAQTVNIQKAPTSPSSEIYQLFRDSQGYIWMGTEEGLYRFDGKNYDYFRSDIYTNPVSGIQQDKEGRIWCRNFAGQIFYVADNQLKLFEDFSEKYTTILNFSVKYFPEIVSHGLGDSCLFAINFRTKKRTCLDGKVPEEIRTIKNLSQLQLNSVVGDSVLLTHYLNGNWTLNKDLTFNKIISHQNIDQRANKVVFLNGFYLQHLARKAQDKKYSLFIQNLSKNTSEGFTISIEHEMIVDALYIIKDKWLWVGTIKGIRVIDLESKKLMPQDYLPDNQVSSILPYGKGLLIGTLAGGLYQINNLEVFKSETDGHQIMNLNYSGLNGLHGVSSSGSFFRFNTEGYANLLASFPIVGDIKLSYDPYLNMMSLFHKQLHYYDYTHKTPLTNATNAHNLSFKKKVVISKDWDLRMNASSLQFTQNTILHNNEKWDSSLFKFGNYLKVFSYKNLDKFLKTYRIGVGRSYDFIYYKKARSIYSATALGLSYYHDGIVESILYQNKIILAKTLCKKGKKLLCGTITGKLLEIQGNEILQDWSALLHHEFGYIMKVVYHGNYIFVQDVNHIYRINIQEQTFENMTIPMGVESAKINDILIVEGKVYLATEDGVIYFDENLSLINESNSNVFLKSVTVNDRLIDSDKKEFGFQDNNYRFTFRSLDLTASFNKFYKYKLQGFDEEWIYTEDNAEFAQYKNLKPGEYRFEVYALDINNIPSAKPAVYYFTIRKAFYNTWWFRILAFLVVFTAIGLPFYIRSQAAKRQNQLELSAQQAKQQLAESQLSALRSQMNPHFIFNALNSIQEFIVLNKSRLASSYLGKFADLMRAYLNQSKSEYISLHEEVKTLKLYLEVEKIRFEETLRFNLDMEDDIPLDQIMIPPILLQPFVENAIKHGLLHKKGERKLDIKFVLKDGQYITCLIRDNGVGRKKSNEINSKRMDKPRSFATSASQKRLELLNANKTQKIKVQIIDLQKEGISLGTEVQVDIPIRHFSN